MDIEECVAVPASACGTRNGWRAGGRCWKCRAWRNATNRRRRGMDNHKRALAALPVKE